MLHLILGGAGSGKSARLTDSITADVTAGRRAWLIIPEQQANLSERTLLPKLPAAAGLTFNITGFSGLCRELSNRYGGAALVPLTPGVRSLLMWQNLREMNGLLQEYHAVSPRSDAHLTGMLLQTIDELRQSAITPTMLEHGAKQLTEDSPLRAKLYDLALLYASYDHMITQACDGESADELTHLCRLLDEHDYFAGGNIYIDSFTSFTAEEYAVLRAMLRQADHVTVTLCVDEHLEAQPSHDSLTDTYRRLLRLAARDNIPVQIHRMEQSAPSTKAPELHLLERHLWDLSLTKNSLSPPSEEERGALTVLRCTNIYAEAEATALHILDLVHRGYAYGDIAVIVRDAATYRGILDAALERYGIPFYFSEKTSLLDKPLSRLLLCALRAVTYGWQTADILGMLKTGLCPVCARDLDLFEQYVATWNINGAAFAAPTWTRNPDGYTENISERGRDILAAANRVREIIMTPLLQLYTAVAGQHTLPELCEALYDMMHSLSLSEECARLAHDELAAGYLKQAGETIRVYDTVLETLTAISTHLPDATLDVEEFTTALSMVFSHTEIASVPSLHDSVTIGSADTLRVENIAVSFLLGLNEGEFPKAISDEGLLCDAERRQLDALGIKLDTTEELRSSNELLFVWRAMTKPSQQLFISTQLAATDGKDKTPSVAYHRLFLLFPYLKERVRDFDLSMIAPANPTVERLHEDINEDELSTTSDAPDPLYQPLAPSEHDLSPELLARLFDRTLWLTQSKIQNFVLCPYSFYCTYFLAPRQRQAARIDYSDSGTFLHFLLEQFLRRCLDEQGHLHLPAEQQIEPLADQLVNTYLRTLPGLISGELRTLHVFRKLRALTLVLLRDILHELSHSRFTPRAFELKIGDRTPDAPAPYEVPLEDGRRILLGGTVDRVDFYRRGDDIYLRVIDYKSSAHDVSLEDIRHGLNLQLLIYLFTLCRPENVKPAGALYVATAESEGQVHADRAGLLVHDEDLLAAMNDQTDPTYLAGIERNKKGELTGKALTDPQELAELERDIRETLRRIGQDMLCGRAPRTPSADACRYCSLKDGCPEAVRPKKH